MDRGSVMIDSFSGKYRWLSNFWPVVIVLDGLTYPTVEHAFQAYKTVDEGQRRAIRNAKTPGEAKRLGREVTLRPDWDNLRVPFMTKLIRQKFTENEDLRKRLLNTGFEHIEEGNTWGDTFWGTVDGVGENHLGKIIMQIRDELNGNITND